MLHVFYHLRAFQAIINNTAVSRSGGRDWINQANRHIIRINEVQIGTLNPAKRGEGQGKTAS